MLGRMTREVGQGAGRELVAPGLGGRAGPSYLQAVLPCRPAPQPLAAKQNFCEVRRCRTCAKMAFCEVRAHGTLWAPSRSLRSSLCCVGVGAAAPRPRPDPPALWPGGCGVQAGGKVLLDYFIKSTAPSSPCFLSVVQSGPRGVWMGRANCADIIGHLTVLKVTNQRGATVRKRRFWPSPKVPGNPLSLKGLTVVCPYLDTIGTPKAIVAQEKTKQLKSFRVEKKPPVCYDEYATTTPKREGTLLYA